MKSIPFNHMCLSRQNDFRESLLFSSPINALVWILNMGSKKISYDIDNMSIEKYILQKYCSDIFVDGKHFNVSNLDDLYEIMKRMAKILNIHIIYCHSRESIKYFGYPFDNTKHFVIIYQYNGKYIPIVHKNKTYLHTYDEIEPIFYAQGKKQSSLRIFKLSYLQSIAQKLNIQYKINVDDKIKNKSKQNLYEEILFAQDNLSIDNTIQTELLKSYMVN